MSGRGMSCCKECGCSEIDTDPARGDAVCTNCGCVLEASMIVSEVTFVEDGHGGASTVGQFVSADSRGCGLPSVTGGRGVNGFHTSVGKESREITLRNSKKKIVEVAQQLRLNQHCIDVAYNFFKMALHKQLTKGRKNGLTIAAVIYMTCRIEGTPHLLIDFSDVLQMDVYALGRAYCQISRALYINIPAVDPCMYILRFAHKFELGDKTHEVAMTALRMVQRMKRDWIHLGRRPSGLCGAALLIAARLHSFSRSVQDVIRVVKVHETTLRKRLVEFGETPSSSLTLDEFMSVDLEEEHDPPSYKAARIRDRERLQKLLDSDAVSKEFQDLQTKIEIGLDRRRSKMLSKMAAVASTPTPDTSNLVIGDALRLSLPPVEGGATPTGAHPHPKEIQDESHFILESTLETINSIIAPVPADVDRMLMPPPAQVSLTPAPPTDEGGMSMALVVHGGDRDLVECPREEGELDLDGIDDSEINGYIMTSKEVERKTELWEGLNRDYIESQRLKQEQLERDILEGKVDKRKKKKSVKAKPTFQAKSANEAIKIMLKERKISSKINYDVLRSLTAGMDLTEEGSAHPQESSDTLTTVIESGPIISASNRRKWEAPPDKDSDTDSTSSSSSKKKSKASRRRSRSTSVEEEGASKMAKIEKEDTKERKPKVEKIKVVVEEEDKGGKSPAPEGEEDKGKLKKESKKEKKQLELLEQLKQRVYGAEASPSSPIVPPEEEEEEEVDEEEEEEVEEMELSARDLLRDFRGEAGGGQEDEDYYE